jgi:hypothetical protein
MIREATEIMQACTGMRVLLQQQRRLERASDLDIVNASEAELATDADAALAQLERLEAYWAGDEPGVGLAVKAALVLRLWGSQVLTATWTAVGV